MNPISLFMLGAFTGAIISAVVANMILRSMEKFMNRRLDYWSGRVTELQEQVNELEKREDGEEWKGCE